MAIKKLNSIVASRIAAGEVVERPASVLRELLDNSIDAGADVINVWVSEGGISSLKVSDNGCGIDKEDLPLAFESHATSKVETLEDLFSLKTLGFRGEALCSIAACSRLTISSKGCSLCTDNGVMGNIMPSPVQEGTTIVMEDIFEQMPARKQFLKRPSAEMNECKKVFIEKALGFENVNFTLYEENKVVLSYKACGKRERVLQVLSADKNFMVPDCIEMSSEEQDVKLFAISSGLDNYRRDRGQIKIFVNNRIVDCFPLVQVIANAYNVALPGGAFPFFYLFIEDNPSLIDFNIHPAKRECKIRNQAIVNAVVTYMIRSCLKSHQKVFSYKEPEQREIFASEPAKDYKQNTITHFDSISKPVYNKPIENGIGEVKSKKNIPSSTGQTVKFDPSWFEKAKKIFNKTEEKTESPESKSENFEYKYIGQVFNTFLVVEVKDSILFIDQHAAHERILYDQILENKDVQPLVIPYRFETDKSVDDFLTEYSFIYADLGVEIVRAEPMLWEINTVPAISRKNEKEIADYISTACGDVEQVQKGLFSVIACHSAVKAGDVLDNVTANSLVDKAFKLDRMVCPHGRSFTYEITKEELFKQVGRIL